MSPFGRITIIDPCSSLTPVQVAMILHPYFLLILSMFHKVLYLQDIDSEGNLCNITQMNPIDISAKPDVIEHVHVGKNCSTDESEAYKALFKEFRDIFFLVV